jgi:TRAP-type C4-dicarboxylate transport system substrate-binding protein
MKKLSFSRSLACVSLLALLASGASAAEKVTLKLAHNLERSHVVHQAFEAMSKEVNQLSDGDMKIRIYPSSQMGSARNDGAITKRRAGYDQRFRQRSGIIR